MRTRRAFITLLGGAAAAWPLGAQAQQPTMPIVGYLGAGTPETWANVVAAFRKGLAETGYVEGRNLSIEFRFAQNELGRLPESGLSSYTTDLEGKRAELLKELVPGAVRIAGLYNMGSPVVPAQWNELQTAARKLGLM